MPWERPLGSMTEILTNAARLDARGRIVARETPQQTARRAPADLDRRLRIAVDTAQSGSRTAREARFGPIDSDPDRRLRIAVDFDGVLFDHVPYVLRGFRDAHGIDLEEEGMRYWDFFQYRAVRGQNLTWNCVRSVLERIDTDPAVHEMPPKDPHAGAVMRRWMTEGHDVSVVTARTETSRAITEKFLVRHQLPHHKLVMGASRKTGYDVLVDDAPHNVLMAAADGGLAVLMDQPYNRDVPTRRNPVRVRSWRDVERVVAVAGTKVVH